MVQIAHFLLRIDHTVVRSKNDYSAEIYPSVKFNNLNKLINTIHYGAIRLAIGTFRTAPIDIEHDI